jgi:hypothetical protein
MSFPFLDSQTARPAGAHLNWKQVILSIKMKRTLEWNITMNSGVLLSRSTFFYGFTELTYLQTHTYILILYTTPRYLSKVPGLLDDGHLGIAGSGCTNSKRRESNA